MSANQQTSGEIVFDLGCERTINRFIMQNTMNRSVNNRYQGKNDGLTCMFVFQRNQTVYSRDIIGLDQLAVFVW